MAAENVSLTEHLHLSQMQESLRRKLQDLQRKEAASRRDSMRAAVMSAVVSENYDRARREVREYVSFNSAFPDFQDRADRYVQHCCDLIQAIQTKRAFPGLASLSLAKQQEIHEKVLQHFEELKQNLQLIERLEREYRLRDIRSTVWVLRALCQVVAGIIAASFIIDLKGGLFTSLVFVINYGADEASAWLVNLL